MTVEERLTQLENEIQELRLAKSVVFTESIRKQVLPDAVLSGLKDTTLTSVNHTTNIGVGGGSVNHASAYTYRLPVYIDGALYDLGLYPHT